jgi:hypothetical protein
LRLDVRREEIAFGDFLLAKLRAFEGERTNARTV